MTTILLILSVAMNLVLFVWAVSIWRMKMEWESLAMDWKKVALDDSVTLEFPSTPGTSTESPTPAPDAD